MRERPGVRVHPTADVSDLAELGEGTSVWNQAQIRERVRIGRECILGKDVYVDFEVTLGDRVKVQNGAQLFHGLRIANGVFVGPGVIFTNDLRPRAIRPDGALKGAADWTVGETRVEEGASIGAGAIVLPGLRLGRWSMIAAGAVVTRDVPAHALVAGSPARRLGWVCGCGERASREGDALSCGACGRTSVLEAEPAEEPGR